MIAASCPRRPTRGAVRECGRRGRRAEGHSTLSYARDGRRNEDGLRRAEGVSEHWRRCRLHWLYSEMMERSVSGGNRRRQVGGRAHPGRAAGIVVDVLWAPARGVSELPSGWENPFRRHGLCNRCGVGREQGLSSQLLRRGGVVGSG